MVGVGDLMYNRTSPTKVPHEPSNVLDHNLSFPYKASRQPYKLAALSTQHFTLRYSFLHHTLIVLTHQFGTAPFIICYLQQLDLLIVISSSSTIMITFIEIKTVQAKAYERETHPPSKISRNY
ncbi:hypothetical protein ACLOJK_010221 [Asimina triloba]